MTHPDPIASYGSLAEFASGALGETLEAHLDVSAQRLEDLHPVAPYRSPLFRADYFSLVFVRQGQGRCHIDHQTYALRPGTIYFTNPGHVKGFELDAVSTGVIVTASESFLKHNIRADVLDVFPFLIAEAAPPFYATATEFAPFDELANQVLREYGGTSPYRSQIIGSLMHVLLLRFKEAVWDAYDPRHEGADGSLIVAEFRRNLEAHMRDLVAGRTDTLMQVQAFAAAQHLHPNYFSTVIRHKTGRTVSAWITDKVAIEAKTLLGRGGLSVKDTAYRLGFSEPSQFSRFFKKQTGQSPSDYRRRALADT